MVGESGALVPPVLYVPVPDECSSDEVAVEVHRMRDGRLALLAYTALDRLVRCCGEGQPWVAMPTAKLDEIDEYQPYDVVLLDVERPEALKRTKGGQ